MFTRTFRSAVVLVLLTLVTLAGVTPAHATELEHYAYSGDYANATFYAEDDCLVRYAMINAAHSTDLGITMFVNYEEYDTCNQVMLRYVEGWTEWTSALAYRLTKKGHTAQTAVLDATFNGLDYESGTEAVFTVHADWINAGRASRTSWNDQFITPGGTIVISRGSGFEAPAVVSGNLMLDGVDLLAGMTPIYAVMETNSGGTVLIQR